VYRGITPLVDQFLFGASSIILIITTTRWAGVDSAGRIALAMIPYTILSSALQGVLVDPLLIRNTGNAMKSIVPNASYAVTAGCLSIPGVVILAVLIHLPVPLTATLLFSLPLMLGQYVTRSMLLAHGRARSVLVSDAAWLLPQLAVVVVLVVGGANSTVSQLAPFIAWCVGGVLAFALLAPARSAIPGRPSELIQRVITHRNLWGEIMLGQGGAQANAVALAGFGSPAAVGVFRSAQTLTTPILLVVAAARHPFLPWLVTMRGSASNLRRIAWFGLLLATTAGATLAAAVWALMRYFGTTIFGDASEQIAPVAVLLALDVGLSTSTMIASLILTAVHRADVAFRLRSLHVLCALLGVSIAVLLTGSALGGAAGLLAVDGTLALFWAITASTLSNYSSEIASPQVEDYL
jgi:O-antigen/teichoic acid export membrane protein